MYTPRLEGWPRVASYRAYRWSLDMYAGASTVYMQTLLKGGSEQGMGRVREAVWRLGSYVCSPYNNVLRTQ